MRARKGEQSACARVGALLRRDIQSSMDLNRHAHQARRDALVKRSYQSFCDRPARLPVQVQRQDPTVVQVQQQPNPVACVQLPVDGILYEVAFVEVTFQAPVRVIGLV